MYSKKIQSDAESGLQYRLKKMLDNIERAVRLPFARLSG
jgi:hypothetical protein